ncbi:MAG: hypothetical protein IPG47_10250 [Thermoflexaceae bacterium]|nr:hypothetical protein [Thermoflexaceae bacterium]
MEELGIPGHGDGLQFARAVELDRDAVIGDDVADLLETRVAVLPGEEAAVDGAQLFAGMTFVLMPLRSSVR